MTDHEPAPVPWPGIEPAPFEFPYAEAATARIGLDELVSEITAIGALHSDTYAGLTELNQGETVRMFRLGHAARMEALGWGVVMVMYAIDDLDDLVARARAAEQQRADAHAGWASRNNAYQQARADGHPVGSARARRGARSPTSGSSEATP